MSRAELSDAVTTFKSMKYDAYGQHARDSFRATPTEAAELDADGRAARDKAAGQAGDVTNDDEGEERPPAE